MSESKHIVTVNVDLDKLTEILKELGKNNPMINIIATVLDSVVFEKEKIEKNGK